MRECRFDELEGGEEKQVGSETWCFSVGRSGQIGYHRAQGQPQGHISLVERMQEGWEGRFGGRSSQPCPVISLVKLTGRSNEILLGDQMKRQDAVQREGEIYLRITLK